ncbi:MULTISPECIES: RHS repeat-associated core domain-containing protein [Pseudomonas]|uniref:RHS repeat-associated core domain-containing protein n=1 Tax=Pseudomonas sp. BF-R-19 TaxID=2832397 RepID=UPI001CBEAC2E|nr:RHS repeat-associated core domain-containing protein [Pseudomonas sp. BF-R-19]
MNAHTPSLSAVDSRGLPIRAVAYWRQAADESPTARVTQQMFDPVGRLVQQRDPRLFALSRGDASVPVNLTTTSSLSAQTLCSDSVDAGWQLGLPGAAGQALEAWDQRGWHRRSEHDSLLRAVAVHEQMPGEPERCVERMSWGVVDDDHALHNRCGQLIRQDDPAGSRLIVDYGLSAAELREHRHFLSSVDPVHWPLSDVDRDDLLEPGEGAQSSWTYAPSGEARTQTDAKGHTRHFTLDLAGQLHSVGLQRAGQTGADTLVSAIQYSASGQVEHELAGNGMRSSSTYDPADGHLMLLATKGPDQTFLQKLSYRYDAVGNITEITDAALPSQHFANQRIEPVRRFTYDTLHQLISASGWESARPSLGPALPEWQPYGAPDASRWSNYSETYLYDEAGNLLQRIHHGAMDDTLTMQVATLSNRSVKVHSGLVGIDESFDARGNLLELQPGQRLQWNARNQLAQVTQVERLDGVDDAERYVYDSEGTRLRRSRTMAAKSIVHTAEVRYLPGIELRSNSATGEQLQVINIQAGRCTVRLLHWDSPPPAELDNDQLRYCFDDHLRSSVFEVDAQAWVISQEVYYPYGGTAWLAGRHEVESSYKTIRYSGKERDATGLYYYGARYYAPWLQRWLNPDPAGDVDGVNFYRFVRNNPINYIDLEGNTPAPVSDYRIGLEKNYGVHHLVMQRGMDNIRKHAPALYDALIDGLMVAKKALVFAMNESIDPEFGGSLYYTFFGEYKSAGASYLEDRYKKILSGVDAVERGVSEVIIFLGAEKGDSAFVLIGDLDKNIYINKKFLEVAQVGIIASMFIHEISHQDEIFGTVDYYYLGRGAGALGRYGKNDPYGIEMFNEVVKKQSLRMIKGEASEADLFSADANKVFAATESVDQSSALSKYNLDPDIRSRMGFYNADSLAGFSIAVLELKDSNVLHSR